MYGLISQDYLVHHGIKGMKWGIRHDPERLGRQRGSKQSSVRKKKKGLTKTTKLLLGTAALAGVAAIGVYAGGRYLRNGRLVADNIIKAGTTIKQVTNHPENIKNGEKIFVASRKIDQLKYKDLFAEKRGALGLPTGEFKQATEATVSKDLKIAGIKTTRSTFDQLMKNDQKFASEVKAMTEQYKHLPGRKWTGKEWDTFATVGPLGNPSERGYAYNRFVKELSNKGYHGHADLNDRVNSGFNTNAHVLFNYKNNIGNVKVSNLSEKDIRLARKQLARYKTYDEYITPENLAFVSGGTAATGGFVESNSRQNKRRK